MGTEHREPTATLKSYLEWAEAEIESVKKRIAETVEVGSKLYVSLTILEREAEDHRAAIAKLEASNG